MENKESGTTLRIKKFKNALTYLATEREKKNKIIMQEIQKKERKEMMITIPQWNAFQKKRMELLCACKNKSLRNRDAYEAVARSPLNLVFVEDYTWSLCELAVSKNGLTLRFVPDEFKTESVCLKAVKQDGMAMQYIPTKFQTYKICLAALKQNSDSLKYLATDAFHEIKEQILLDEAKKREARKLPS